MPRLGPIRRNDLISHLRKLGFDGPYAGGKHQFMIKEATTITIPNPHTGYWQGLSRSDIAPGWYRSRTVGKSLRDVISQGR
jgi:predicted RNA binding protein YcfA (HicA-like mRNA interferase family)